MITNDKTHIYGSWSRDFHGHEKVLVAVALEVAVSRLAEGINVLTPVILQDEPYYIHTTSYKSDVHFLSCIHQATTTKA